MIDTSLPPGRGYFQPLAEVHEEKFSQTAEAAATVVVDFMRGRNFDNGNTVDLGCGGGQLSQIVAKAGYSVQGLDLSPEMIAIARNRVPNGEFYAKSFIDAQWMKCHCLTAIGEVFNYLFDENNNWATLEKVFERAFESLEPGGLFMFDMATKGRLGGSETRQQIVECEKWSLFVDSKEQEDLLERKCILFVKDHNSEKYIRSEETHHLRLADKQTVVSMLEKTGFETETKSGYGELELPHGMFSVRAIKPSTT